MSSQPTENQEEDLEIFKRTTKILTSYKSFLGTDFFAYCLEKFEENNFTNKISGFTWAVLYEIQEKYLPHKTTFLKCPTADPHLSEVAVARVEAWDDKGKFFIPHIVIGSNQVEALDLSIADPASPFHQIDREPEHSLKTFRHKDLTTQHRSFPINPQRFAALFPEKHGLDLAEKLIDFIQEQI